MGADLDRGGGPPPDGGGQVSGVVLEEAVAPEHGRFGVVAQRAGGLGQVRIRQDAYVRAKRREVSNVSFRGDNDDRHGHRLQAGAGGVDRVVRGHAVGVERGNFGGG